VYVDANPDSAFGKQYNQYLKVEESISLTPCALQGLMVIWGIKFKEKRVWTLKKLIENTSVLH